MKTAMNRVDCKNGVMTGEKPVKLCHLFIVIIVLFDFVLVPIVKIVKTVPMYTIF